MTSALPDAAQIVQAVAFGQPVRDVAAAHGLTEAEVRDTIGQEAARCFDGEQLRRELLLETQRLEALGRKYFVAGMRGDLNAAALYCKISERKATLIGLNAPIGHAVQLIHATAPPEQMSSTERLREAVDRIRTKRLAASDNPN